MAAPKLWPFPGALKELDPAGLGTASAGGWGCAEGGGGVGEGRGRGLLNQRGMVEMSASRQLSPKEKSC